jgi:hypothetical protein
MARRLGLTAIGLAALAAVIAVYTRLRPAPVATDESARIRALEARLALLEKQRSGDSRALPPPAGASDPRLVVPVPPGTVAAEPQAKPVRGPLGPAPAIDETALQREYFGDLDVRLGSETRDPLWAAATEERLRSSVRDLRPRITVDNAQCGQTMCRVEATVPDPHEEVAAMDKFLSTSLALFPEAVVRDGEGPGRHVVYFARRGSEFPPMDAPEANTR